MFHRITFDPKILGGRAAIRGMRIPVSVIVGQIAHGAAWDEVLRDYPDLEHERHPASPGLCGLAHPGGSRAGLEGALCVLRNRGVRMRVGRKCARKLRYTISFKRTTGANVNQYRPQQFTSRTRRFIRGKTEPATATYPTWYSKDHAHSSHAIWRGLGRQPCCRGGRHGRCARDRSGCECHTSS